MTQTRRKTGIVIVDHGSQYAAANEMLLDVTRMVKRQSGAPIVEPAHMELAEPTIEQAFGACIAQGAEHVIVHPYFLAPGRHSTDDIPRMAGEAAAKHSNVTFTVTGPLGVDRRIIEVVLQRIQQISDSGPRRA